MIKVFYEVKSLIIKLIFFIIFVDLLTLYNLILFNYIIKLISFVLSLPHRYVTSRGGHGGMTTYLSSVLVR